MVHSPIGYLTAEGDTILVPTITMPRDSNAQLQRGVLQPHVGDDAWGQVQRRRFDVLAAGLTFMREHPEHAPPIRHLNTERDADRRLVQPGLHHNPDSGRWSYTCLLGPDGLSMDDPDQHPELAGFMHACGYMARLAREIGLRAAEELSGDLAATLRRGTVAFRYMRYPIRPGEGRAKKEPTIACLGILLGAENGTMHIAGVHDLTISAFVERNLRMPIIMPGLELEARHPDMIRATRHFVQPAFADREEVRSTGKAYFMVPADERVALPKGLPLEDLMLFV